MWIPFTPNLREPGFTVRVEIRGTAALPNGGSNNVMGADEAFVHLGLAPLAEDAVVEQAVGVALDDGVVVERPSDPGPDEIEHYLTCRAAPRHPGRHQRRSCPTPSAGDWDWCLGLKSFSSRRRAARSTASPSGPARLDMDMVGFSRRSARPSRGCEVRIAGTARPQMTLLSAFVRPVQLRQLVVRGVGVSQRRPAGRRHPGHVRRRHTARGQRARADRVGSTGFVNASGDVCMVPLPPSSAKSTATRSRADFEDGMAEQDESRRWRSVPHDPDVKKQIT